MHCRAPVQGKKPRTAKGLRPNRSEMGCRAPEGGLAMQPIRPVSLAPGSDTRYTSCTYPNRGPSASYPWAAPPPKSFLMAFRRSILCFALGLALGSPARGELSSPTSAIQLPDAFAGQQLVVA